MNTHSLALALALAAGTTFAANAQAAPITTLETVQVRPAAEQIAQQQYEANSGIITLSAVQVRPSVGQIVERDNASAAQQVMTLASIEVRPSPEQRATLAAEISQGSAYVAASSAVVNAIGQWVITLPTLQVRPSALDVQSLAIDLASGLIRP